MKWFGTERLDALASTVARLEAAVETLTAENAELRRRLDDTGHDRQALADTLDQRLADHARDAERTAAATDALKATIDRVASTCDDHDLEMKKISLRVTLGQEEVQRLIAAMLERIELKDRAAARSLAAG